MSSCESWPCAVLREADLSSRTTMRVGGRAQYLLEPSDPEELRAAWKFARDEGIDIRILGGGANLLPDDGLLPGAVIDTARMRRVFRPSSANKGDLFEAEHPRLETFDQEAQDTRLVAWAGASMPGLVRTAAELGWSGLEGLVGVPGSLGGGVAMNAGGRWGEMWDVVESVRLLQPDGELVDRERSACTPSYRNGALGDNIVVGAVLKLKAAPKPQIQECMRQFLTEKRAVQPVTEASSGCVWKNPDPELSDGRSAGRLIQDYGCKGLRQGGAQVSELHGNFIINRGGATAADVFALIEAVRARVADGCGILLQREVRVWMAPGRPEPAL